MFRWMRKCAQPSVGRVLLRLNNDLARGTKTAVTTLSHLSLLPPDVSDMNPALTALATVRAEIQGALEERDPETALKLLTRLDHGVRQQLCGEAGINCYPRQTLAYVVGCLAQATAALRELGAGESTAALGALRPRSVLVPTDLLYRAHQTLFPAERMVVVAGERGHAIRLGQMFDVTGEAERTHVRADSRTLAQALITMQKSGRHFAAWGHSHPGLGPRATYPSPIDHNQHAAWIRHYAADLLSFIVVEDGFIRFFGTALDEHRITVSISGQGVLKQKGYDHVYRIDI